MCLKNNVHALIKNSILLKTTRAKHCLRPHCVLTSRWRRVCLDGGRDDQEVAAAGWVSAATIKGRQLSGVPLEGPSQEGVSCGPGGADGISPAEPPPDRRLLPRPGRCFISKAQAPFRTRCCFNNRSLPARSLRRDTPWPVLSEGGTAGSLDSGPRLPCESRQHWHSQHSAAW